MHPKLKVLEKKFVSVSKGEMYSFQKNTPERGKFKN